MTLMWTMLALLQLSLAQNAFSNNPNLRGSAEDEAEVAEDVNFTEDELFVEEAASNLTLDSEALSEASKCHGQYMGLIQRAAPGCLRQCRNMRICDALNHAIRSYGPKERKDRRAAEPAVCSHQGAFS